MRDIVWTIIGIWIVWKIFHAFKTMSTHQGNNSAFNNQRQREKAYQKKEGVVTIDHLNDKHKSPIDPKNTEYVDYEEIK